MEEKWWRVSSKDYHHKILPNIDQIENWGGKIQKRVITNSLGFFDKENREILKSNKYQKRILLIGDFLSRDQVCLTKKLLLVY